MPLNLSVNLNKVALLRNARGGGNPAPLRAAEVCIDNGAAGLTLHWREDNRHTREQDVRELCAFAKDRGVEFNLEGDTRDELVELALALKPTQLTLVPVTPGEVTSDHGWDLPRETETIRSILARANDAGIRTAIFMDPDPERIELACATETQRVEIYTEPYASTFGTDGAQREFARLRDVCRIATAAGLGVNAGHDLDLRNTPTVAREIPEILEVSIGHALVSDALHLGLDESVRRYVTATRGEATVAPITQ